jgi:hypothetical protein
LRRQASAPLFISLAALGRRVTSDKTHVDHNESAFTLVADIPGDMDFRCNGPPSDSCITANCVPIRSPDRRVEGRTAASATPPMCDFINTPPASPATKAIPGPITAGLTSKSHAVESFSSWKGHRRVRTPIRRRVAPSYRRKNRSQDCPSSRPECLALGWV